MRNVISAINAKRAYLPFDFKELKIYFDSRVRPDEVTGVDILVAGLVLDVGIRAKCRRGKRQHGNYAARKKHRFQFHRIHLLFTVSSYGRSISNRILFQHPHFRGATDVLAHASGLLCYNWRRGKQ